MAGAEGDRLLVTEPFASGFSTDRPFTLVGPDGYELTDATPEPDDRTAQSATWAAGTSLEGFAVTLESSADDDGTDGSGDDRADGGGDADDGTSGDPAEAGNGSGSDALPGFGPLLAALALAASVAAALRSRRR